MSAAAACAALLPRDVRAVLRSRSQLYSSMLFPLMLLAILGTGVSEGLDPTLVRDGDYASFLVPGTISMTVLFSSTFSSASYYQDRECGLLRVLLASPHEPQVILLGKALAGVSIGGGQRVAPCRLGASHRARTHCSPTSSPWGKATSRRRSQTERWPWGRTGSASGSWMRTTVPSWAGRAT